MSMLVRENQGKRCRKREEMDDRCLPAYAIPYEQLSMRLHNQLFWFMIN
jgi:hypothetical protein